MHAPSLRGRKRKNQSQNIPWDQASAIRANMPRASRTPGAQAAELKRPYYNIVFGREQNEDIVDSVVDPLDIAVPRDLSAARYAQNHALMSEIFGQTRLDLLKAPPSAFEGMVPTKLQDSVRALEREIDELMQNHANQKSQFTTKNDSAVLEEKENSDVDWAQAPSKGRVLGIGYVPADIPEEVKRVIEDQRKRRHERESQQHTQAQTATPAVSAQQPQTQQTEHMHKQIQPQESSVQQVGQTHLPETLQSQDSQQQAHSHKTPTQAAQPLEAHTQSTLPPTS